MSKFKWEPDRKLDDIWYPGDPPKALIKWVQQNVKDAIAHTMNTLRFQGNNFCGGKPGLSIGAFDGDDGWITYPLNRILKEIVDSGVRLEKDAHCEDISRAEDIVETFERIAKYARRRLHEQVNQ